MRPFHYDYVVEVGSVDFDGLTFTFSAILLDPDLLDRFCLSGNKKSTGGVLHHHKPLGSCQQIR
jgi:hypothetical protein